MFRLLDSVCPTDRYEVFFAPLDWQPDTRTSLQPDLLVVGIDQVGARNITSNLALAVEVLSPSTRRKDRLLKFSKYQDAGVASYWIVEPDGPAVTAYDLHDGTYVEVGTAVGSGVLTLTLPFPVAVQPSELA